MFSSLTKILITGGAGFIGYGLSKNLVNKGFNVTILDNLSKKIHSNRDKYNYLKQITKFIIGDINCRKDWEKAILHQDAVLKLLAKRAQEHENLFEEQLPPYK